MEPQTHTIDAKGQTLGRVATQAAHILMDKNLPSFEKHKKSSSRVRIINASGISFSEKRVDEIRYKRASGYQGNFIQETIAQLRGRRGVTEVVRRAVYGMIPNNKLRTDTMKRLEVTE